MTAPSAAAVIKLATSQVGVHEGRDAHGNWSNIQKYSEELPGFAWSDGEPWCDTFVGWCFWKAGLTVAQAPRSASCATSMNAWKGMGRWSEYPAVGAQVIFENGAHTGVVVGYDANTIQTVEGNTNTSGSYQGDGVYAKTHQRRDPKVTGYGYPDYPEGIVSADPAWQGKQKGRRVDTVDISNHQSGALDFAAAKAAGVRGAFHKATEGTGYTDPFYPQRRPHVTAAGLAWGAYHFARPSQSDGATQARRFLAVAGLKRHDFLPVLDLEDNGGLTQTQLTRWVKAFVDVCKAARGGCIIYTQFTLDDTFGCPLWASAYSSSNATPRVPGPWKKWALWQFTDGTTGVPNSVPGLGHVDADTLRGRLFLRLKMRRLRIHSKATPPPPPPPPPVPATTKLDAVTWNVHVKNHDPAAGAAALIAAARPRVIFAQEAENLPTTVGHFKRVTAVSAAGDPHEDDCAVLLHERDPIANAYLLPGTPGMGTGVNQYPRKPLVVLTTIGGLEVALICVHPPYVGPRAAQATRDLHAAYAAQVVAEANVRLLPGHLVIIGGDGNHRPHDGQDPSFALWAQLEAGGWTVVRHGLDLIAFHPDQVTQSGSIMTVPPGDTGSDHAALKVPLEAVSA